MSRGFLCLRLFWLALGLMALAARAADEDALQELWQQHLATPENHVVLITACEAFVSSHPSDPLVPVARGLEEWHQLRAGHQPEAVALFRADLAAPADPVAEGARRVALGWLTRLDREQVVAALHAYYLQQIAYPNTLDQLTAAPGSTDTRPPMTDRFGKPWAYRLTGFAKVAGFTDQKYSLQSTALGNLSDFPSILRLPYGTCIQAQPLQVIVAAGRNLAVKFGFPDGGQAAVIGAGQSAGELYLAYVGTKIVVVCDYTHWKIFPRP